MGELIENRGVSAALNDLPLMRRSIPPFVWKG
jgi:hypothetical protein